MKLLKKNLKNGRSEGLEEPSFDLSLFKSQKQREKEQKDKERQEKRDLLRQIH